MPVTFFLLLLLISLHTLSTLMVHSLYLIFDIKAESTSGPLMSLPNDAVARRTFQDALTGQGSILGSHPEDYELRKVGMIDRVSGEVVGRPHEVVITGDVIIDAIRRQQQSEVS